MNIYLFRLSWMKALGGGSPGGWGAGVRGTEETEASAL